LLQKLSSVQCTVNQPHPFTTAAIITAMVDVVVVG